MSQVSKQKEKVKIYSTPTCHWCHIAKDYLKKHKIEFSDLNVAEDEDARNEMIESTNQMGVPVIDINGTVIIGFDKEKIDELLHIKDE